MYDEVMKLQEDIDHAYITDDRFVELIKYIRKIPDERIKRVVQTIEVTKYKLLFNTTKITEKEQHIIYRNGALWWLNLFKDIIVNGIDNSDKLQYGEITRKKVEPKANKK